MKKKVIIVLTSLILLFFCVLVIKKILAAFRELDIAQSENLPSTHTITPEYINLFTEACKADLTLNITCNNKYRNPVSLLYFKEKFNVLVYKLDSYNTKSLNDLIKINSNYASGSTGVSYRLINDNLFSTFQYRSGKVEHVSDIIVSLNGDSLVHVSSSEKIAGFHLLCKRLAIRYGENMPVDLFIVGNDKLLGQTEMIPLDIIFLNRDSNIYFLIMTPRDNKDRINPRILYDLLEKNTSL